ncbi:MAG TPA: ATP-binding protein [Candidatus Angelobacter sp.]|nr:ATP-binding protein [Candidatus Angelobacter sp.]
MASELLQSPGKTPAFSRHGGRDRLAAQRMRRDFLFRFSALLLALLTLAAVIFAVINYSAERTKETKNPTPVDGVWWVETGIIQAQSVLQGSPADKAGLRTGDRILSINGEKITTAGEWKTLLSNAGPGSKVTYVLVHDGVKGETSIELPAPSQAADLFSPSKNGGVAWTFVFRARQVIPGGPADHAGIKPGDLLLTVNNQTLHSSADLIRQFYKTGTLLKAYYELERGGVHLDQVGVILEAADRSLYQGLRLIALIYLGIGVYVLLRRWTAPKSTHFYLFCLVSFVLYSFHYTGKLNLFDWIIYWGNIVACSLQPALFLHFALTFPAKKFLEKRAWLIPLVYVPGAVLVAIYAVSINSLEASEVFRWNLDRLQMLYLALYFIVAAAVLWDSYRKANLPILRQQMKWISRGTVLAIAPFTLFYVVPFLSGAVATPGMKVSWFSLVFLPLTFGYAILRYRLMDVDIIFKRGVAYTLATAAIVGAYFAVVAALAEAVHTKLPNSGPTGLIAAIIVTALAFDPLKNWFQERVDRFFYRKRYDYRRTLIEFGRELSSETDLGAMLSSVIDRLSRTLLVDRIAIFLATGNSSEEFVMAKSFGISYTGSLDLSFLVVERPEFYAGHIFFDNTRKALRESATARETIAKLDLNYYIPCTVQNRTIAVVALGKTMAGDFLSSEDVELLETLAGYIGIAIQNAKLYASLEQKASEYERLKDFNENIVESISVGVLAVDLEDRIESWNAQMEVMYAMSRAQVLGERLSEVFPGTFMEEFYRFRQNPGIHNLYKFRLNTPAGDTRITNVAIAPLVTRKFNVIGRLIIVDDITERIELESQLSQAEKMSSIGLLAAGVAHEVNTPLAVISSYAQMLIKQVNGDEKVSSLLEKITRQTFRASEIVNNLLNFSRTSSTEFSDVNVNKIIAETITLLEHQFKTSQIKLETDLDVNLPLIYGNPGKLQQVFLNLFVNAKDAMAGTGGTLSIRTAVNNGVSIIVSDTGAGIAPEHISKIYDPFFTTKTTPREGQSRGTGLGLSVTYGIIQEHAGKIRVESNPGQGTSFYLEFPLIRKAVNV